MAYTLLILPFHILGAGPAGISAVHTLTLLLGTLDTNANISITLFEKKTRVGGRMALSLNNVLQESGVQGKILAEDVASGNIWAGNPIVAKLASGESFLQSKQVEGDGEVHIVRTNVRTGFFDGKNVIMSLPRPVEGINWKESLSLLFRYGLSVSRAKALPVGTMRKFRRMIGSGSVSASGWHNESVESWVRNAGLLGELELSARERLNKNGVGGEFTHDVVEGAIKRQWGQSIDEISDLALSAGLEREFSSSQTDEGQRLSDVLETVLRRSLNSGNVTARLENEVLDLQRVIGEDEKEEWLISVQTADGRSTSESFDQVILAGPWNTTSLLTYEERTDLDPVPYLPQWVTFVTSDGNLDETYFGSSNSANLPDEIVPIPSAALPDEFATINSLVHLRQLFLPSAPASTSASNDSSIQQISNLYRITSSERLNPLNISRLFTTGFTNWKEEEIPHAYPMLFPRRNGEGLGNVKVKDGLWHTGVSEAVMSSVDWSWVVGEKTALRVWEDVQRRMRQEKK